MRAVKAGAAAFAAFFSLYLVCAFANWSFDAGTWSDPERAFCALIGGIMGYVAFSMVFVELS